MIQLDLPMPPSVNGIFVNVRGKGRVKSTAYRKWREQAGWEIIAQGRPNQPVGKYELQIALRRPNARSDLENRCKPIGDLLQEQKVIKDDRYCQRLVMWWTEDLPKNVDCRVWIQPVEAE